MLASPYVSLFVDKNHTIDTHKSPSNNIQPKFTTYSCAATRLD